MNIFQFADVTVGWQCDDYRMLLGEYMEAFTLKTDAQPDILIRGRTGDLSPYENCPVLASDYLYDTCEHDGEILRLYNWSYLHHGYAVFPDRLARGNPDCCLFDPKMEELKSPMNLSWFLGICGLHKALLLRGMPILHASYIDVDGGAILFSAPSGTGKSTQAALWQRCAGAQIVNGDRVLLGKRGNRWFAHGYPNCGSSDICINRSLPLRAIILLAQGTESRVEPVQSAVKRLVSGMVVTPWDSQQMEVAFSIAEGIASSVPVLGYTARNDPSAVTVLREYLEANNL